MDKTGKTIPGKSARLSLPYGDKTECCGKLDLRIPSSEQRVFEKRVWTEYCIKLTINERVFTVFRRYSEFYELQQNLQRTLNLRLPFPGKKFYGNLFPEFVDSRRKELEQWLRSVLEHQHARDSPDMHAFLDCQQGKYLPCSSVGLPILEPLES